MYTSSFVKNNTISSSAKRTASSNNKLAPPPRPRPGSHEAQQALWTSVAIQQHILRTMAEQGRAPAELRPPRPLPEGQLSLAQKMGIAELPPQAPNEDGWAQIETETAARGDLSAGCAICCMPFLKNQSANSNTKNPVCVLSCSHCFHSSCLQNLEKHAKSKRQKRKCPICRAPQYFSRKFVTAPAVLQKLAVIKIQSVYRGHRARKFFIRLKMKIDPQFRSDYYYRKLKQMTDLQLAQQAAHDIEVDLAMEEMDYAMEISRVSQFREKEDWIENVVKRGVLGRIQQQTSSTSDSLCHAAGECAICCENLFSSASDVEKLKRFLMIAASASSSSQEIKLGRFLLSWEDLEKKSSQRLTVREEMNIMKQKQQQQEEKEKQQQMSTSKAAVVAAGRRNVVVANTSLGNRRRTSSSSSNSTAATTTTSKASAQQQSTAILATTEIKSQPTQQSSSSISNIRALCLTSCGHLYHSSCLRSLEQFVAGSSSDSKPKCCLCRKGYVKRLLFEDDNIVEK